jgi:hypothetical protein
MAYTSAGFTDTQDNQKNFNEKYIDNDPGPYIGTVKVTVDPLKMGRLGVNIPALSQTTNPTSSQIIWCQYLSPFYGAKSINAVSEIDPYLYKETQHSYGMWAVPPDVDTDVLVIFAKGEQSNASAFWIGCVQKPLVNQQVPGHGASINTSKAAEAQEASETSKLADYGTEFLPAGEKNQRLYAPGEILQNMDKWKYPVNDVLADQLKKQGLVQDTVRGTTSSSARRESPSRVFGINTPGRIRSDSRELNIGLDNSKVKTDRDPGHSFVMDDGATDGTNQLTRLRTASGHQLLMHDTEGVVYLANGSGKAFIEMAKDGTISVYSDGGINLRSGRDFNLHSDMNINFHAKGAINFTSETNVALNAEGYVFAMGDKGVFTSSQNGVIQDYALKGITSYTPAQQLHGAKGQFHLQGSQVHFNKPMGRPGSGGGTSIADWGPSWLKPDSEYVRIKVTGGEAGEDALIDIDDDQPYINGVVNKRANKTTVTDFVTHEPYGRKSSTQYKKDYVNQAIEQIKKTSPEISSTELKLIKAELLKQPTVKAVADKLGKVVKLNDNIKLPVKDLNNLLGKATEIQSLINDPKLALQNFVYGKVAELKSTAVNFLKSKFKFF